LQSRNTTNASFTKTLGEVLHRPTLIPIPEFAVNLLFGEGAFNLTQGAKLYPKRVIESGYTYKFPNLKDALTDVLKK
jgi:NAD dependent epimerase/dehydratase family enzyme